MLIKIIIVEIYVTFDIVMELLSYGENVKVLEPLTLRETIKYRLKTALALYEP